MNVRRFLVKYDKTSGKMIDEYDITSVDLDELRSLFGESASDPMFHSYDVTQVQCPRLQEIAGVRIELARYDYCVDASSD